MDWPNDVSALRAMLDQFVENARYNGNLLARMQDTEFRLVCANSFDELMRATLVDITTQYQLADASLVLLDPAYEIQRILYELNIELAEHPHLLFLRDRTTVDALVAGKTTPHLGAFVPEAHAALFPQLSAHPACVAIVPLVRRGELIGCLALADHRPDRFVDEMGTDFLGRLGAIAAVCIENVLNAERLRHIGLTDALTGVHNRRYFDERLREEIDRQQRLGGVLACVFIDIDHFKQINDGYGHPSGDHVLREVAGRIKTELRVSDTLGRYGGEEFAVLLAQTDESPALAVAERIRRRVADQVCLTLDGQGLPVTVSLGVATLRTPVEPMLSRTHPPRTEQESSSMISRSDSCVERPLIQDGAAPHKSREQLARELLARADTALYRSKSGGRNQVTLASD